MSVVVAIRDGAAGLAFLLLAGFVSANVRRLAAEKGLDNFLLRAWDYAAAFLPKAFGMSWREKWWFWVTFGLSVGIAVSLWIVSPTTNNVAETTAALRTQITNLQATLDTVTQQRDEALRRAGMQSAPPPVVLPLTADEIRAKIDVWKSIVQLMADLTHLLDQGDAMLDTSLDNGRGKNQSLETTKAHQFARAIYDFRLKLESTHDSLAGHYADVAELLKETVRSGGRTPVPGTIFDQATRSSEGFANELSASSADILREDLQAVRNWGQRITNTATANRDALVASSK